MNSRPFLSWLLVCLHLSLILYCSSLQNPMQTVRFVYFPGIDKFFHIAIYAVLGFLFVQALCHSFNWHSKNLLILLTFGFGILFGILDEYRQYFVPTRSVSIFDVAADGFGSWLGALFWIKIFIERNSDHAKNKRI